MKNNIYAIMQQWKGKKGKKGKGKGADIGVGE